MSQALEVIAVTIGIGERFAKLAQLAAESCRQRTKLSVCILGPEHFRLSNCAKPQQLKFLLFEIFPNAGHIIYFNADTIFLKDWQVPFSLANKNFVCARDFTDDPTVLNEAMMIGLVPELYFNSGIFIASRAIHRRMLLHAGNISRIHESSFLDQTYLNEARAQLRLGLKFLEPRFNVLRVECRADASDAVVGQFRWIHSKPPDRIESYFRFWQNRRERWAAVSPFIGELIGAGYEYKSEGDDGRSITFQTNCEIGKGTTEREKYWEISMDDAGPILWLSSEKETTAFLLRESDGHWRGQRLDANETPVSLRRAAGVSG